MCPKSRQGSSLVQELELWAWRHLFYWYTIIEDGVRAVFDFLDLDFPDLISLRSAPRQARPFRLIELCGYGEEEEGAFYW